MNSLSRATLGASLVVLLTGCATTQYHHHAITDKAEESRQLEIDDAQCTAVSYGAAPMPQVHYNTPAPSQAFSGTVRRTDIYDPARYEYRGTITPVQAPGAAFAQGMANGMNMGAAMAAKRAREKIYHGCMLQMGWSTEARPVPVKQAAPPSATPPAPLSKQASEKERGEERWHQTIATFLDVEAASPGGIDYRAEPAKMQLLDITVKGLANDPKNEGKSMSWFLIEANRLVKAAYAQADKQSAGVQ